VSEDKNKQGFSGLSSLASDIDEAVAEQISRKEQAQKSADSQREGKPQPSSRTAAPRTVRPAPPPKADQDVVGAGTSRTPTSSSSGVTWGRVGIGVLGIGVLIWLINVPLEDIRRPSRTASFTPPSSSQSYAPTVTPGTQISDLEFARPPVGDNNVLSVAQIRWCLREDIRIEVLRPLPTTSSQIDQFNAVVSEYNRRCGSYRYRQGTLTRAEREIERVRAQIVASIQLPWRASVSSGGRTSQRPSAGPAQPRPAQQWSQLTLDVQNALTALGYDPGPVDGLFGPRTRAAIEIFERERELRVTGNVSSELLAQLKANLASSEPSRPSSINLSPQRTTRLVPTAEERSIATRACAGKKALYGPVAYDSCVAEKLQELQNLGRRPNLGGISSSERSAITNACAGKKSLYGPAAYYTCVEEKLAHLASVGTAPSFSGVSASERSAIENACAGKKALYGPASYYECVREKISELTRGTGAPDFAGVSRYERDAIENACAGKKALHGPAAFYACARGMIQELRQLSTSPDLSRLSYADRSAIENACAGKKALYGPAAFYRCVEQQIGALR